MGYYFYELVLTGQLKRNQYYKWIFLVTTKALLINLPKLRFFFHTFFDDNSWIDLKTEHRVCCSKTSKDTLLFK